MPITVYSISGAPRPWRLLLGLAFKGLDYELRTLEASKREHKSEPFISLNPRGTVPVLVDGPVVIRDSMAALAWLDRAYPDQPLFGAGPAEAAEIWQVATECADYLRAASDAVIRPLFFENATGKTLALEAAAAAMAEEASWLERMLDGRAFLVGDAPNAADAVAFPEIRLMQRAVERHPAVMAELGWGDAAERFPRVAAWMARIEALPGVARTYPPHWSAGPARQASAA